jgi:hypothetical protein
MDTLGPAMQSLLDDADALLTECGRPTNLVSIVPGNNVAWDNCCGDDGVGGQLWVRTISILPQPQGAQPCDITYLQVRLGLGTIRCMAGLKDDGGLPTATELEADALNMTRDADTLLRAIRDWDGTTDPQTVVLKTLRVEQGVPLGPTGYCGGWEWTLAFGLLMRSGC